MNEPIPSPPVEFKDRSTGLMIFGLMTILLGCLCVLFVVLMILGEAMSSRATPSPANHQAILPAMCSYGVMAVALIWLGIGSMKARRWARALLLIFSWSWLVMGVMAMVLMMILLPQFMASMQSMQPGNQAQLPASAKLMMVTIMMVMMGVIFVVLPGIWVFFYRSPHVKATCIARDPVTRWTDACPLPVLAVSLWLALGTLMMLLMPLAYRSVLPFFGTFLVGISGTLGYLVLATIWAWSAWAIYHLDVRGWWLIVASMCLFTVSHVITYSRHDVMELYSLMGYPEQQMEQLKKFNFLSGGAMVWGSLLFTLPFLGYLVYLKKFFRSAL